jgi:transposase
VACHTFIWIHWNTRPHWYGGLAEARHGGRPRRLDRAAERELEALLARDPQAEGELATTWTVPLLRTYLRQAGYVVSEHTLRRTLHRLGGRRKRPRYVLGRPDPA